MLAESFIHLDNEVIATTSVFTNKNILSSVLAGDNNVDNNKLQPGDMGFDIECPKCPSEGIIDAIRNTSLFSSQQGEEINYLVKTMQNLL